MLNKSRIENNPYRILGVYVGSPLSVEVNHLNRIRAFAKVGQAASFDLCGDNLLAPIIRTEELAYAATQTLSLVNDRVENALLWFSDGNTVWGRILNNAVQGLIEGDYTKAINNYEELTSDDALRNAFLASATHGLLTLSREELSGLISELISSCDDDWERYWMLDSNKPTGRIALILFEKIIPARVEDLILSIEYSVEYIDFYELIGKLENTLNEIIALVEKIGGMYGYDSIRYKGIVDDLCRKLYARGTYLIREIGKFVWLQNAKNRPDDTSYKKYRSKMPVGAIRACMDLIRRVDKVVDEAVSRVRIDETSKMILYSDIHAYQSVKQIEFVDSDDIIRHSVHSFYIKRGITVAGWLAFLYWMFWIV